MTEQVVSTPPEQVSAEEYWEKYAHDFYEWEQGRLVNLRPFTYTELRLADHFRWLLEAYFSFRKVGRVLGIPFLMRLDATNSMREPDLQVILESSRARLTQHAMIGPADICIEIVSEESTSRDYGRKFVEYEKAGVPEYWIVDPLRRAARFCCRNAEGLYQLLQLDEAGSYESALLPGLKIHVPTLWQEPLPDIFAAGESVCQMLGE